MSQHSNAGTPKRFNVLPLLILIFLSACAPAAPASTPQPITPAAIPSLTPSLLPSLTPSITPSFTPLPLLSPTPQPAPNYHAQPGDTLAAVAARFGVEPLHIRCAAFDPVYCPDPAAPETASRAFDAGQLLPPGAGLFISGAPEPAARLLPDSEIVFSASAAGFDPAAYIAAADGYMATHAQYLMLNGWNTGADIIQLVARENSINPRLLIALLEYQCACIRAAAETPEPFMGAHNAVRLDLYGQLVWAVYHLSNGYYGWRAGTLTEVTLTDGTVIPLNPHLNAGTAALYNLFAQLEDRAGFAGTLDPQGGFAALYRAMFGNPWSREITLFPAGTLQPALDLPFEPGLVWSYTGGPHSAYEGNGPRAALDFAPASAGQGCLPTTAWVTAAAGGVIVRAEFGTVVQDLDGDGLEQTGWNIMYLHIAAEGRAEVGNTLHTGDRVGQPSCEGGRANGTHLHIARKFNGEWVPAGAGALPFNLGGWIARQGAEAYQGTLTRGTESLTACTCSWRQGWIKNED